MGVALGNCKNMIALGYFGFQRLRSKVAELLDEEFGNRYKDIPDVQRQAYQSDNSEKVWEAYNNQLNEIIDRKHLNDNVLDFLFQADCNGKLSYKACRSLYSIIKDYDDDVIYGYSGQKNPVKFADFKAIVEDCCKHRRQLIWY